MLREGCGCPAGRHAGSLARKPAAPIEYAHRILRSCGNADTANAGTLAARVNLTLWFLLVRGSCLLFLGSSFLRFFFFPGIPAPSDCIERSGNHLAGRRNCCRYNATRRLDWNRNEGAAGCHETQDISQYDAGFHISSYTHTTPGSRLSSKLLPEHDRRNDQPDGSDQMSYLLG